VSSIQKSLTPLLFAAGTSFAGADVYVVTHSSVQISSHDVRPVFLGDKQFAGTVKLVPIDNAPRQQEFLARALRIDGTKYNLVWTKKAFREGLNPPPMKSGDAEVIDFVKRTPGAVGYVSEPPASPPSAVLVVQKF
jgi:hypothetical protein